MNNLTDFKNIINNVIIDFNGKILNHDAPMFRFKVGKYIQDFHPLFLHCLEELDKEIDASIIYPGVFIDHPNKPHYCDIRLKREPQFIAITLFNYTSKYVTKQQETQLKNEAELGNGLNK